MAVYSLSNQTSVCFNRFPLFLCVCHPRVYLGPYKQVFVLTQLYFLQEGISNKHAAMLRVMRAYVIIDVHISHVLLDTESRLNPP